MRMPVTLFTLISLVITGAVGPALQAQSPAFEVATAKVNRTGDNGATSPELRNGTLTARNVSMKMLLRTAYDLSESRITGPDWLDSDRFDVAAKSPQGVPDSELMPMLQALLKDRFHLVAHREMKEMPVFDMVVAKGGLKMSPFDPAHPAPPRGPPGGSMDFTAISTNGVATMSQLALRLTASAGRPVFDKTGVEGRYGFFLMYTPIAAQSANGAPGSGAPDFFTAVQQQLGLRLEPTKASVEILVVAAADRVPTEN
jgi:uncharacterized protein (TIGR03435 family)